MNKLINYFIIFFILFANTIKADVKLPKLIGDGMVLQRDHKITIWGWANANEEINVTFKNKVYRTKTDKNSNWKLSIEPQRAGGPYVMIINNLKIQDILIGDVWLCSGQSNMEATMNRPNIKANYADVIKTSNYPMIRQFVVKKNMLFNPVKDVESDQGWVTTNSETILNFSAVAYFFAKDLHEKYKVPIGIINSSVGGTPVQSWVSSESLKHYPTYDSIAQKLKDTAEVNRLLNDHQLKSTAWYKSIVEDDLGTKERWFLTTNHQQENWEKIENLNQLSQKFNTPPHGSIWFKTMVSIPKDLANTPATLSLGSMQTEDETYLNGKKIGSTSNGYSNRNYALPKGLLKEGENTITIRIVSPTTGISFNQRNIYQIKFSTDSIALNNHWLFRFGIKKEYLPKGNGLSAHSPTAYYYPMIKPLSNYHIKGIVWYQGESNVGRAEEYEGLLTNLIKNWRKDWQQDNLPFLYVQLANYLSTPTEPAVSNWALLREAQTQTLKVPYTAMAVIHDVGERKDLHPKNKRDVGKRLALAAQKIGYYEDIVFSGPLFKSAKIKKDKVYVKFDHIGSGLKCVGEKLNTFTISADGIHFLDAEAKIIGNQVVVWNNTITKPIAIRYAWADSPDGANLYNKEGLAASSFKSN